MSIRAPMQVSPSGLVFYYDTFNPKSYKGKPTTNLLTYTNFGNNSNNWYSYCGNGNGITNNTTEVLAPDGTYTATKVVRGTSGACDWTYNGWGILFSDGTNIFTSGQTYTVSIWARCDTGTMSFILGLNDSHSSGFTITTNWQRITFTATATGLDRGLQFITYDTSGRTYYVWGPQSELGTYATQYTPSGASRGTRTVTNGLVDLNENYTVDLTNAGYDSNANITFNGSSNYITAYTIPDSFWNAGSWSVSVWIKFNSVSKGTDNAIFGHGAGSYSNGLHLAERSSAVYFGFYANDLAGTIPLAANKWYNIVWVFNYSTKLKQIYVNGVFDTSGGSVGYSGTGTNTEFGRYPWSTGNLTNSTISSIYGYNKVLTASEVLQNYNRTKSRFGL